MPYEKQPLNATYGEDELGLWVRFRPPPVQPFATAVIDWDAVGAAVSAAVAPPSLVRPEITKAFSGHSDKPVRVQVKDVPTEDVNLALELLNASIDNEPCFFGNTAKGEEPWCQNHPFGTVLGECGNVTARQLVATYRPDLLGNDS